MIDLILICVIGAAFIGGFKAGNRFKTFREMLEAGIEKLKKQTQ